MKSSHAAYLPSDHFDEIVLLETSGHTASLDDEISQLLQIVDEVFLGTAHSRKSREDIRHGLLLCQLRSLEFHRLGLVGLELVGGLGEVRLRVSGIGWLGSTDEIAKCDGSSGGRQRFENVPPIDRLCREGRRRTDETGNEDACSLHFGEYAGWAVGCF